MFERNLGSVTIDGLKGDGLFTGKLEPNIRKRAVFPAIRAGCVEFYHKGGKLFSYAKEFSTHKKYASVIESDSDYISESDLRDKVKVIKKFFDGYEQIKGNCSEWHEHKTQYPIRNRVFCVEKAWSSINRSLNFMPFVAVPSFCP